MAHLFRQIYSDEILNLKRLTKTELIKSITVEFIHVKLNELNINKAMKEECFRLWDRSEHAKKLIDRQQLWKLINEAFKILKYKKPSDKYQTIYEQTLNLSSSELQTIHLNVDRTVTFENLIDYLTRVCKIKYSV